MKPSEVDGQASFAPVGDCTTNGRDVAADSMVSKSNSHMLRAGRGCEIGGKLCLQFVIWREWSLELGGGR